MNGLVPPGVEAALKVMELPDKVRLIRVQGGIGRCEIAAQMGVHRDTVRLWEKGERLPRTALAVIKIQVWAERIQQKNGKSN